jgi:DNA-binding transcriptional LysR family regulator
MRRRAFATELVAALPAPARAPTKYTFVVNMAAAGKLGLALAPTLLARADEVVE